MRFNFFRLKALLTKMSLTVIFAGLSMAAPSAASEPVHIVGFGDSLMAGFGLAPGEAFPDRLEEALRSKGLEISVTNAGVSGDTTSGGLSRLEWSIPAEADLVLLELGANDMLRGIAPEATAANLDAMIEKLKMRDQKVILLGMRAAPNLGPDYEKRFNAIFPGLADKHGLPLIPFFLDGVAAEKNLLLPDGMHPNAKGVEEMVRRIAPEIATILAEMNTDPS